MRDRVIVVLFVIADIVVGGRGRRRRRRGRVFDSVACHSDSSVAHGYLIGFELTVAMC